MFLKKLHEILQNNQIPFAVVGGYAVAIYGVARGTFDVDIITELTEQNLIHLEKILSELGLKSTIPISASEIFKNKDQLQKDKNLIAWNFVNPDRQRENLDIVLTEDIRSCSTFEAKTDFGNITVIGLDDLIRMKSKTGRIQDEEDVRALKTLKGN